MIEGVEDIDRVSEGRADLTQVKRRSAELKLSTKEAAVAVGNYLVAAAKNSDHELYFSYVTTAPAGVEPRTDFRTNQRAILVWGACAQATEISGDLFHDLAQLPELISRPLVRRAAKAAPAAEAVAEPSEDEDDETLMKNEEQALRYLGDHIRGITPDHFLESIVRHVRWDVSSPDTEDVIDSVCSELATLANTMEIRPKTLQECRFRLLARVMDAARGVNHGRLTAAERQAEIITFLETLDLSASGGGQSASVEGAIE